MRRSARPLLARGADAGVQSTATADEAACRGRRTRDGSTTRRYLHVREVPVFQVPLRRKRPSSPPESKPPTVPQSRWSKDPPTLMLRP